MYEYYIIHTYLFDTAHQKTLDKLSSILCHVYYIWLFLNIVEYDYYKC